MTGWRFVRHTMAHERGAVVALATLVVVVTVVVVAIPRWLESTYDDALRQIAEQAPPESRLVEARSGRTPYGSASAIQHALEQARTGLGAHHQEILGAGYWSVAVPDLTMTTPEGAPRFPSRRMALRLQSGWESKVRLVEGTLASMVGSAPAPQPLSTGQPADVLDIVLTPSVADDLDIAVGDVVFLVDPTAEPIAVRLTGLVEPIDADDPFWAGLGRAIVASHEPSDADDLYRGVALVPESAYDTMARLDSLGLDTRLRYPLASPDRLRDDDVPALRAEFQTARTQGIPGAVPLPGTSFLTSRLTLLSGLDPLFEQHLDQRRAAAAVSAVQVASLLVLGAAVLWLAARAAGVPPGRGVVDRARAGSRDAAGRALAHHRAGGRRGAGRGRRGGDREVAGAGEDNAVSWWLAVLVLATALVSLPAVAWRRLHAVSSSVAAARGAHLKVRVVGPPLVRRAAARRRGRSGGLRGEPTRHLLAGGADRRRPVARTGPVVGCAGGGAIVLRALPASAARVGEQPVQPPRTGAVPGGHKRGPEPARPGVAAAGDHARGRRPPPSSRPS